MFPTMIYNINIIIIGYKLIINIIIIGLKLIIINIIIIG